LLNTVKVHYVTQQQSAFKFYSWSVFKCLVREGQKGPSMYFPSALSYFFFMLKGLLAMQGVLHLSKSSDFTETALHMCLKITEKDTPGLFRHLHVSIVAPLT